MPRLYLRMPKSMVTKYVTSFLGFMDIKVGCQIISLFSLFNKIAGVYGIMAMFQGGSFSQLSLYIYSIATIPIFIWGLKVMSDEKHQAALKYAHLYFFWTISFLRAGWCSLAFGGMALPNTTAVLFPTQVIRPIS